MRLAPATKHSLFQHRIRPAIGVGIVAIALAGLVTVLVTGAAPVLHDRSDRATVEQPSAARSLDRADTLQQFRADTAPAVHGTSPLAAFDRMDAIAYLRSKAGHSATRVNGEHVPPRLRP